MIDWEKPRADDFSYDIGCFLSEPAQLWCAESIMSAENRFRFLELYCRTNNKDQQLVLEKVSIREPLILLHWILWGALKLCDIEDSRTPPVLLKAHEEKIHRYERLAQPERIEKLLDMKISDKYRPIDQSII